MILFANAKINLGLNIISRRPDGFHNLDTCFYPIGLYAGLGEVPPQYDTCSDIIEVSAADADSFTRRGNVADCPPHDDLTFRALQLFRHECNIDTPVALTLYKRLPFGAGLGGGSADAGCTLRLLNEFFSTGLTDEQLAGMAVRLGADCPFFIYNSPRAAKGVGNIFTPLPPILNGYWGAIVQPGYTISTREAFQHVIPRHAERPTGTIVSTTPPEEWRKVLFNGFEFSMFALHPEAEEIKIEMYEAGAVYASMSGSGSAFYGIFRTREAALNYLDRCTLPWKSAVRF